MKKMSLLIFAILVLGCENQNPVAELDVSELDQEISELKTIADQLSQTAASLDRSRTTITAGTASSVADGDTDVDPEPLNRDGIRITFSRRIALSHFNLHDEDGTSLDWRMEWSADGQTVTLTPPHRCAVLRPGKTYTIDFVVQDFDSWKIVDSITFSTKPQSVKAAPALSIEPPEIAAANVIDRAADVDFNVLNRDGIVFSFSEPIAVSHIDLRLKDGPTLGWIVQWHANQQTVTLRPPNTCSILMNNETYVIDISVSDYGCWQLEISISFTTAQ